MGGLGVVRVEGLNDHFLLLFVGQLFLINASHLVVLVHIQKVGIVFQVLASSFFLHDVRFLAFISQLNFLIEED